MANHSDSPSDDGSAFHNLIRHFTRLPATLKTFPLSETYHHPSKSSRAADRDSYHPLRKFIASLFQSDPPIDSHQQSSELETEPVAKLDPSKRRMNNLILDGFLKNNGGYLDDSGSSSGCSELDEETDEEGDPNAQIAHEGNNISILARKHQTESTAQAASPTNTTTAHHPRPFNPNNLSKRLLHFHLGPKSDHRKSATVVFNKPAQLGSAGHARHCDQPHVDQLEPCQGAQNGRLECRGGFTNKPAPDHATLEAHGFQTKRRWHAPGDRKPSESARRGDGVDLKHLHSSTFSTENSVLGCAHDLRPRRAPCLLPLRPPPHPSRPTPIDDHHPRSNPFKSPFRNLVLGQDDLLRST